MAHISVSETIDAPASAVFAYVDDHRNTTRYMRDLTRWEPAGDRTHGKGSTFSVAMKAGPVSMDSTIEITTWTENRAIAWVTRKGTRQDGSWTFREKGGSTEATLEVDIELPGGLAGRLLARAAEPVIRMSLEKSVRTLKSQVEKVGK
jgi:uncharacterized membrane protein